MVELSTIHSAQNPALKRLRAVERGKEPEMLLLEGERLIEDALGAGLQFELLCVAESRADLAQRWQERLGAGADGALRLVRDELLAAASSLVSSPGAMAIARRGESLGLGDLLLPKDALVLVVAGVSDPGNLGALARSAEAAGASALVALEGGARPENSKALRGSMGSLLRLPVVAHVSAGEVAAWASACGLRQVRADMGGAKDHEGFDWSGGVALWVAGETGELPREARGMEAVRIPMAGGVESLNVSVAASLLLYAAGRWRALCHE